MRPGSPRLRRRVLSPSGDLCDGSIERLGDGEVSVWLAEPAAWGAPGERGRLLAFLSGDEQVRMGRFYFDEDRLAFLTAHALVRIALSRSVAVAPARWTFVADAYGKPDIASPASSLRFSLTHTRTLVACAVAQHRAVGIDVEDTSRAAPLEVAERYFAAGERTRIFAAAPGERSRRFFEYWTLKEAYAKALGLGLSLPFDRFEFQRDATGAWRLVFAPPPLNDPAGWWFDTWTTPTHQAAVAVRVD